MRADDVRDGKIAAKAVCIIFVPQQRHERKLAMATTSYLYHTLALKRYQIEEIRPDVTVAATGRCLPFPIF